MKIVDRLASCLSSDLAERVRENADDLTEIRLRAGRDTSLTLMGREMLTLRPVNAKELKQTLNRLMDNSVYAWENEMKAGYFTIWGGCRVGVCGKMNVENGRVHSLANIGSICIRIPREIKGCAREILPYVLSDHLSSVLIVSPPGLGKTTMMRDLARGVSAAGYNVAIADERREIAACYEGVPQLDVGERTDVMDNCPKALALPMLIRSCAPKLVLADEIGSAEDAAALYEARRSGVAVAASAHAVSFAEAERRRDLGGLLQNGIFDWAFLLGGAPGRILGLKKFGSEDA